MHRYSNAPNWTFLLLGIPIFLVGVFYLVRGVIASRRGEPSVRVFGGPALFLGDRGGYVPTRMAVMLGVVIMGAGAFFAFLTYAFS